MKHSSVYLIGLTGNIACGKSSVLAMLRDLGAHVIDADRVTHQLQQPGQPVYDQIVTTFGPGILVGPNGPIDRRKLAAIVFSDPQALRRLEQIVHPAVHARIEAWLEDIAGQDDKATRRQELVLSRAKDDKVTGEGKHKDVSPSRVAVIDAIKLIEAGWKPVCDAVWVVTCTPDQQLARLMTTRGMSEEEARGRIAAQPPQSAKVAQADVVIDNNGSLDQTRRQVKAAWQAIPPR